MLLLHKLEKFFLVSYFFLSALPEAILFYSFSCKFSTKIGDAEEISKDCYYKLKGTKVIVSLDDEFTDADTEIEIASMYKLGVMKNAIALYVTIGVGVLALLAIVWPSKR